MTNKCAKIIVSKAHKVHNVPVGKKDHTWLTKVRSRATSTPLNTVCSATNPRPDLARAVRNPAISMPLNTGNIPGFSIQKG